MISKQQKKRGQTHLAQIFKLILFVFLFLVSETAFSQGTYTFHHRRPDIKDTSKFNGTARQKLGDAIHDYLTVTTIDSHANMKRVNQGFYRITGDTLVDSQHIHTTTNFLPWHRYYIRDLEDYLLKRSDTSVYDYSIFVPLPYWDPQTSMPVEFSNIDASCVNSTGDGNCSALVNLNLGINGRAPTNLTTGSNLCSYLGEYLNNDQDDHSDAGGFSFDLMNNYHSDIHLSIGGAMGGGMRSPSAPIFWLWHAYVDEIWYSYDCNCTDASYTFKSNQGGSNGGDFVIDNNTPGLSGNKKTLSANKIFVKGQIIVTAGKVLEIAENVVIEFAPADTNKLGYADNNRVSGILVEPGGKLIVKKGAVLQSIRDFGTKGFVVVTNANGDSLNKGINNYYFTHDNWNGIRVLGPSGGSSQAQFDNQGKHNNTVYGVVILEQGAIINDAKIGVHSQYGGIIQTVRETYDQPATTDSHRVQFNNCIVSIQIDPFQNPSPVAYRNACYISDCNFKWTYRNPLYKDYSQHTFIKLDHAFGVEICGNTFTNIDKSDKNNLNDPAKYDFDKRGAGIWATNSSFILRKSGMGGGKTTGGCPILPGRVNTFNDLTHAVRVENTSSGTPSSQIGITECTFTNNEYAIYVEGSKSLVIADNDFSYSTNTSNNPVLSAKFWSNNDPVKFIEIKDCDGAVSIVNDTMVMKDKPYCYYITTNNTGNTAPSGTQKREIHFNNISYTQSNKVAQRGISTITKIIISNY